MLMLTKVFLKKRIGTLRVELIPVLKCVFFKSALNIIFSKNLFKNIISTYTNYLITEIFLFVC